MNKLVCVAGAGTMGNGIAHVFAQAGWRVLIVDMSPAALDKALQTISANMQRQVKKGTLTEEAMQRALERLGTTGDVGAAASASLFIEAIYENLEAKSSLLRRADEVLEEGAIIATNTSSISITKLAAATRRPAQVIGMHFMNPVPVMQLVEVIRGHATSDHTTQQTMEIARELGKTPVEVNDYPGFISNRVLMPMINEAIFALWEGVASREAIDTVMKLGMNHPMGPLTLADFIGLDVCLSILQVLHEGFGDPKYRPCPLLRNMVAAGHLGRKSGRGFYDYTQK